MAETPSRCPHCGSRDVRTIWLMEQERNARTGDFITEQGEFLGSQGFRCGDCRRDFGHAAEGQDDGE